MSKRMEAATNQNKKKLYIKTYGCQMNVYDSGRMADLLKPLGFALVEELDSADMVILNTCHIREKAAEKVYSELGRIRAHKNRKIEHGDYMVIAVAGCVGQAEGEEIFARAPFVDIVVGPQSYHNLPALLREVTNKNQWALNLDFEQVSKFDALPEESEPQGISAFLTIQEGCNEFCKFCVVPYTRGAEFSRSIAEIYREALRLAIQGAAEITLLGQNVNAYNGEGLDGAASNLGQLIRNIARIDGIKRIRYTTSHPRSMHDDLIRAHGEEEKLMPFLHLPVQSGSDRILKEMNRKHSAADYLRIVEKLRVARPDLELSSDFIVGYPGETDQDFEDTLAIIREVGYAQAYSFKYSPRPGTPAAMSDNQIPDDVKSERLAILQALTTKQQNQFNQSFVGKTTEVLFDKLGKYEGQIIGRTPYMQSVHAHASKESLGKVLPVYVDELFTNSLAAKIINT